MYEYIYVYCECMCVCQTVQLVNDFVPGMYQTLP